MKFIIDVRGDLTPTEAFYYAMKVAQQGLISGEGAKLQHCYHSVFGNGVTATCIKRGKSERFIIQKP